ncbi:MAG: proprotein convertase P-domain-containing protein [Gammaproteobacteria bacterium]
MSTSLTGYFSGGTGSINNGVGAVNSGVAMSVTPTLTTTYTLTVTDPQGLSASASTTVKVVSPIVLQIGTAALPYTGTIGTNTSGYYQITGMTQGHRYAISINATNYPTITYYSDAAYTQPVQCDPNVYASGCIIEAPGSSLWVRIKTSYFYGSSVTINAVHVSAPTEFEGTWKSPVVLDDSVSGNLPHVGKVDKYNSYYTIQGLTIGKQYTIWLQSMSDDARLGTLDPTTHTWVGGLCNPDKTMINGFQNPESCTWVATDTKIDIGVSNTSASSNVSYILRVEPAVSSEGTKAAPVAMAYTSTAGKVTVSGRVATAGTSYYHVTGLTGGTNYLISLAGIARSLQPGSYDPPTIQSYDADASFSTTSACTSTASLANTYQCTVTASGSDLYFTVVGPAQYSGMTYNLTVSPVPLTDGNPTAVSLTTSSLPYNGQVNEQFVPPGTDYLYSNYTVTGLTPSTFYQVFLKNLTGVASLSAWPTSSSTIACSATSDTTATCALSSDSNGSISIRVGAISDSSNTYAGALYSLDVKPAFQLTTTYNDTSGPIAIPDPGPSNNPVSPVLVPITVSGSPVTSISDVTVEFYITHGYSSQLTIKLIAPDGTVVPLVAPNTVTTSFYGYIGTKLNDYAPERLDGASGGIEAPSQPFYGVYRARLPLHVLRGMDANGTWTLSILDDQYTNVSGQTGEYRAWGISFK